MKHFTSDTHFGHRLMINKELMGIHVRPFETVEEMNEGLIARWNAVVAPNDEVFHLGDVGLMKADLLKDILYRLNGRIYLIEGNHEHSALDKKCRDRFEWVKPYHKMDLDIDEKDTRICLFHYPIASWDKIHHSAWNLHGHCHGSYTRGEGKILDVGIDGPISNHAPISLITITEYMKERPIFTADHHSPSTGRA